MQLHNFFRSGTSHRLRIALKLKVLVYKYVAVELAPYPHTLAVDRPASPMRRRREAGGLTWCRYGI